LQKLPEKNGMYDVVVDGANAGLVTS